MQPQQRSESGARDRWRFALRIGLVASVATMAGSAGLLVTGCADDEDEVEVTENIEQNELGAPATRDAMAPDQSPASDTRTTPRRAQADERSQPGSGEANAVVIPAAWSMQPQGEQRNGEGESRVGVAGPSGAEGLVVRRMQPDEVRAGEPMTYSIVVENVSDRVLRDVSVTEWRRGGFELQSASVDGQEQPRQTPSQQSPQGQPSQETRDYRSPQQNAQNPGARQRNEQNTRRSRQQQRQRQGETPGADHSEWRLGSLQPGQTQTIEVRGMAPEEGVFSACMAVTYEPTACFSTEIVKPQLRIRRQLQSDIAFVCQDVEMRYLVENVGSGTAEDVVVTEQLPEGLTVDGEGEVRFTIGSLEAGQSEQQTVTLRAESAGEYSTYATVEAGEMQARTSDASIRFVRPNLEVSVDGPQQEYVGRDVPINVTVRNTGEGPAMETALYVPGASELSQLSVSTQQAELDGDTINIGRIDPGESRQFTMTFSATEPRTADLNVRANAYCAEGEAQDSLSVELVGVEAVLLETVDRVDPVPVGETTVYEVSVKNQGTATSINVNVTAQLPEELEFVRSEGDSRVRADGQTLRFEPIPRLEPGDIATWQVVARANAPAKSRLRLELTSDATRRPIIEQESTTLIESNESGN